MQRIYLFILSGEYQGSTVLYKLIDSSPNVSSLLSDANPSHVGEGCALFHMTEKFRIPNYLAYRYDPSFQMPMDLVKSAYESVWDQDKLILCDKSIPTIFRAKVYEDYFSQFGRVYFICNIRNPFNCRSTFNEWLNFAEFQQYNLKNLVDVLLIKYENLITDQDEVVEKMLNFLPPLVKLDEPGATVPGLRDKKRNEPISNKYLNVLHSPVEKQWCFGQDRKALELLHFFGYDMPH